MFATSWTTLILNFSSSFAGPMPESSRIFGESKAPAQSITSFEAKTRKKFREQSHEALSQNRSLRLTLLPGSLYAYSLFVLEDYIGHSRIGDDFQIVGFIREISGCSSHPSAAVCCRCRDPDTYGVSIIKIRV